MKPSNKKRVENLEKAKPLFTSPPIVIYDPALPRPENLYTSDRGVIICIPDNGRTKQTQLVQD
jgi:hypothetical protein